MAVDARELPDAAWFAIPGDLSRVTLATDLIEVSHDPGCLDSKGKWAVVHEFEGGFTALRFADWRETSVSRLKPLLGEWLGPRHDEWETSLDEHVYMRGVEAIRDHVSRGEVYQANLCRVMSAPVPDPARADVAALSARLGMGNPAPFASMIRGGGVAVASASPELYLSRNGSRLRSGPIKGTGRTADDITPKDRAENIMIVDLVRNDLSRVCRTGSVEVPHLLSVEHHPGLVHLVSWVEGQLDGGLGWPEILGATFPPGSVTGAPKSSALRIIEALEPVGRGPYCGAIGWVDAEHDMASLAVGIRSFWLDGDPLTVRFGTGAGITWGSDPRGEWQETELKAERLVGLASATTAAPTEAAPTPAGAST